MAQVDVNLPGREYQVFIQQGALPELGKHLQNSGLKSHAAVISDSNVAPLYLQVVLDSLAKSNISTSFHSIPAGEKSKSMTQVSSICSEMIQAGHDRSSFVIALGGGVVGDFAGFVASIFYRGIPFVQIPTTIVSLVDSSVGGKTGVNTPEGKNLLGAFLQPRLVLADPETLRSLEPREYKEGYAEVIKHAAIRDAAMFDDILALDPSDQSPPEELIARNVAIKARIVEEDEKETSGTRALLNFGHTIGHGIEASVPYGSLLHGEAISLGIRAALYLSEKKAGLSSQDHALVLKALTHFDLPLELPSEIKTSTILSKLKTDKKFSQGQIRFVLLAELGKAFVSQEITEADLSEAIEHLRTSI